MEIVTTIVVAIIGSGVINTALNYWLQSKEKDSAIAQSCRLLMKAQLRTLCQHYIQQQWIYEDELEDLIAMHSCYHDKLHGNRYLDDLMSRVNNLEIRGIGVR